MLLSFTVTSPRAAAFLLVSVLAAGTVLAKLEFDPDQQIILLRDASATASIQALSVDGSPLPGKSNEDHVDKFLANLKAITDDENGRVSVASTDPSVRPRRPSAVRGSFSRKRGHLINAVHGVFSANALAKIKAQLQESIQVIEPDYIAKTSQGIYQQATVSSWGLYRTSEWYNQRRPYYYPKSSGSGVDVWVVDTGVKASNQDFYGRAVSNVTFVTTETDTQDTNGHGTFVAGVIGSWTYGIAKRCKIFGVKTMDKDGEGYFSWIIQGVQHAAANIRPGKTVINLSLAGPWSVTLNAALKAASDLGAAVIVAAGNDAVDACTVSPGGASGIISVGALDSTDTVASYSNFGSCVSLFAPGTGITSLSLSAAGATPSATMSGTSMASPHVAGVAALWLADWTYSTAESLYKDLKIYAASGVKGLKPGSPDRLLYSWGDWQY